MTDANAAYDIWHAYRNALESKVFTDPLVIAICEEEEHEWQNIYLKLSEEDGKRVLGQLGFKHADDTALE